MPDANGNIIDIPDKEDQDRAVYATATNEKWVKLSQKFNYSIVVTTD